MFLLIDHHYGVRCLVYVPTPLLRRMLSVEMKEKQQRSLTSNELGTDMEQFIDFLEAISTNALLFPIMPNRKFDYNIN
ncbi:hypothetical protein niasHT_039086 [Heterodera trifolii]|uniref:Uncharacterized protein n=1 Tax=Heterodera trifolii TaxID=157864 RepID=A0ABD2IC03_9BILA